MYSNINETVDELINELETTQRRVDKLLQKAPDGTLNICLRRSGEASYYHRYVDEKGVHSDYIPKKTKIKLAKDLANAQYLRGISRTITEQLAYLRTFNNNFSIKKLEDAYYTLTPERQHLVNPIFTTNDEFACKWNEEEYLKSTAFPEGLRFQTDKGDFVRSKSEVIIANYLHANRDKIFYRYEAPLYLEKPYQLTMHPDFTIISRSTGKIVYLEHCGMMDDAQYANDFVRKMNTYVSNGLIPGVDVILTAETSSQPLAIQALWAQIERVLVK